MDLMLLASSLALLGFRVAFGPRDGCGRPFVARRGGEVVTATSLGIRRAPTPQRFTI